MNISKKHLSTLAIIGNGFDLNHGFQTDFKSFISNTNNPYLEKFKEYCKIEDIDTWYMFEENIRILTERLFLESMAENCDFDENRKHVTELTDVFKAIHVLFTKYLKNEISSKILIKKDNIEKYLNNDVFAINFNYTNTANAYTKNIFYVHGSLCEDNIILGYDYREEPCLSMFEDMQWSKEICRESLAFRRHLMKKEKYALDNDKYNELLASLNNFHHWEHTGRGLDNEVQSFIPNYNIIHSFITKYRRKNIIPHLKHKRIKTLVVLGHGIESDKVFLKSIIEKCINIEKIIIYRYANESDINFNRKCSFFKTYCDNIVEIYY